MHSTKQRLIHAGLQMLLEHGYNDLGIQAVLAATGTPKGSFYHHFKDKEAFALDVLGTYMAQVHAGLDVCLSDATRPPLQRIRHFFELVMQSYEKEGYLGCLMGGLGQELSGANEAFRYKIEECLAAVSARLAACLDEARQAGDIPPSCDVRHMSDLLVDCWEGAALRSRLKRNPAPLNAMLDFYISSVRHQAAS